MANPSQTAIVGVGSRNVKITNKVLATAGTEEGHVLENGLKQLILRSRTVAELKISFISGESGTVYITLKPLNVLSLDDLALSGATLYMQSSQDSATIEIMETY